MRSGVNGFTLTEVALVVLIGLLLASVAVTAVAPGQRQGAVRTARDALVDLHARTRALALEAGETTVLTVDFDADRATITRGATTMAELSFREEMGVDLSGDVTELRICMNANGFGEVPCNSFDEVAEIRFVQRSESVVMRVFPLGQVILR